MRFEEFEYIRPDEEELIRSLNAVTEKLEHAESYESFYKAFEELDQLKKEYSSNAELAMIRHSIDTEDPFYCEQKALFDELDPKISNELNKIYRIILDSPYCKKLKQEVPDTWFLTIENSLRSLSKEIIEDIQEENRVSTQYGKLIASAQIPFESGIYTLASLEEKMNDASEETRRATHKAYWKWFEEHEEEIGSLYDQLVKIRDRMARKLGFENYIPLGYLRMNRLDYNQKDVEAYRRNVLEDVVPEAEKLYAMQAERLGKDTLKTWNEKVEFASGNAAPHFDRPEMVNRALKMYQELDPETGEFFTYMTDHNLFDLDAKKGKEGGGYCDYIPKYEAPFIFANFNKTSHDAEVLTHEAGHAFQVYSSRNIHPVDCLWPTMESAEIDSMSMEFFTWPWMELFFEQDADKYRFSHLSGAVKFIPYGVLVDHFQHEVYANPDWTPKERMDAWRKLEKQYLPHKNYDEIDFLERGGWWMRQSHIFQVPFYYIDYTLAQTAALQFWKRMIDQDPDAFDDYKKICREGGRIPFKQIIETGGLKNPFEEGCLSQTMQAVDEWFENHPANFD